MQQAKDLHLWVQHQTAQGEKNYETKYEFYNLLQCEYEEQCKDACFLTRVKECDFCEGKVAELEETKRCTGLE